MANSASSESWRSSQASLGAVGACGAVELAEDVVAGDHVSASRVRRIGVLARGSRIATAVRSAALPPRRSHFFRESRPGS